jgi:2-polyprenyl-3-methyl-5-hydroxy-6-metoxy-1,4-benzoquinol methylase
MPQLRPSGGRVFEIGAGDGRLLALLAARGYAVSGVEPSAAYAALARSAGVAVETSTAEEAEVDPDSQDAVIAWHVLEHDRAATVARIRGSLAPSGRLIAAVPNLSSIQARLGGDRWLHQDVPRHRTHFTVEGIERLLSRTGYDVVRLRTTLFRPESSRHAPDAPQAAHPGKERLVPPCEAQPRPSRRRTGA